MRFECTVGKPNELRGQRINHHNKKLRIILITVFSNNQNKKKNELGDRQRRLKLTHRNQNI